MTAIEELRREFTDFMRDLGGDVLTPLPETVCAAILELDARLAAIEANASYSTLSALNMPTPNFNRKACVRRYEDHPPVRDLSRKARKDQP